MEDNDRKKILDNINALIKHTNYDKLVEKCLPPLLFPHMIEQIEKSPNSQWHRLLIQKITTRGPTAYNDFLKVLEECEFFDAFRVLSVFGPHEACGCIQSTQQPEPQSLPNTGNSRQDRRYHLAEFKEVFQAPAFVLNMKNSLTIMNHDLLPMYSMQSRNRGVLFLVNNIDFPDPEERRNGAETDGVNMVTLFRALGFIIYYYENLDSRSFIDFVNALVKSEVLLCADCLVFGILTHGDEENYAVFVDEARIHVEDIIFNFNNRDCPNLMEKPKIFLFPFCRGPIVDPGVQINFRTVESDSFGRPVSIPKMSDMLICFGTVPGFRTLRHTSNGSWYIQEFCKVLAKHADKLEFEEMLKLIQKGVSLRRVEGLMQTPYFQDREFNKVLYFNPGCYED